MSGLPMAAPRLVELIPNLGMIVLIMGPTATFRAKKVSPLRPLSLADALFSGTQQRVLGLLFGSPGRSFYANELIGLAGAGSGAVQRELARLEQSGLVNSRRVGNQKHYQANPKSPLFREICSIVQKTVGLAEPLREALRPLASQIVAAFVYGSVAKREDTATSDIDLMVVSDALAYPDVYSALEAASDRVRRTVNPTILSRKALAKRAKGDNAFVTRVLSQPKIWLIGDEHALAV
jgi:predicted nucleotidyltransferase